MTIGKTRHNLVLVPCVSFLVHSYPNMKFKFEKFWRSRIHLRLIHFSKKNPSQLSQLRPSEKSNCVMLRLRPTLKKLNCVICEIVFFFFAISQLTQFSQSILQPWFPLFHSRWYFILRSQNNT